uniref:FLYWCH-type domain-containing protein n=1 Tax=Trichuris muris TaxID=70415 RepID=A0A5S6QTB4_TRIMR
MPHFMSKRNREKVAYNGHMSTFDRLNAAGTMNFWQCDQRSREECKARIHTLVSTGEVIKEINHHCHGSDAARVQVNAICTAAKRRAEQTMKTAAVIFNEAYRSASTATMGQMPSDRAMRQMIRRRLTVEVPQPQPVDRASLIVPEEYSTYRTGERFLLYDSVVRDGERILIFGRQWHSTWSGEMKTVYTDGSFNITPPHFARVYVIPAERRSFVIPVLWYPTPFLLLDYRYRYGRVEVIESEKCGTKGACL